MRTNPVEQMERVQDAAALRELALTFARGPVEDDLSGEWFAIHYGVGLRLIDVLERVVRALEATS